MSGEDVLFDESKLRNSLEKSGASVNIVDGVIAEVHKILYPGITTKQIYNKAFSILRKLARPNAAKYKLKKALIELGPTGYPFEKFVAELLKSQGYQTQVGLIVEGNCVSHEVDVVAENNEKKLMVECKFHSDQKRVCNVKVPLYIQSRFKDVENRWKHDATNKQKTYEGWIFTNTRFTSDAIQYAKCIGLSLVGWDYPTNNGLRDLINKMGLHPVTCLTTITKTEKDELLGKEKILCSELNNNANLLKELGISNRRQKFILEEVNLVCNI
jgi:Holliday junction resolvase-like predicted endonuclease